MREKDRSIKFYNLKNTDYYIGVLKKYAVFSGRVQRKEYWMFFLFNIIISFLLALVKFDIVGFIYAFAVLIPSIAVGVRKLHDTNHSGWWLLIALIPFAGAIVLLVFVSQDGQPGKNKYGPNPKGAKTS